MIIAVAVTLALLVGLVSFVQLLYLESLRLRTKEYASLQFFKETLQEALGYETERGALVFSLIKHTLLVLCGAAATAAAIEGPKWAEFLEGFGIGWLIMLTASYFVPQMFYRRSSGQWLLPVVPFLRLLEYLFRPLTSMLSFLQSLFELSGPASQDQKPATQQEEIEALISAGEEEGIIEKEDSRLIQSVVAFGDKRVREVMTPRLSVVGIEVSASLDELKRLVRHEQYSRIPVYEGTLDHITGFVHVRDLYELESHNTAGKQVRDVLRPLAGVPESMLVAQLLKQMQSAGTHMVYGMGKTSHTVKTEEMVEHIVGLVEARAVAERMDTFKARARSVAEGWNRNCRWRWTSCSRCRR